MDCPKCGATMPSAGAKCIRCTAQADSGQAQARIGSTESAPSSPRMYAQITPYSGPYPPEYVQISSSESQPGPVNILSKWIGILWCGIVPLCILLSINAAHNERLTDPDTSPTGLHPAIWFGLWAVVAIPCLLLYRATRPKSR